MGALDDKVALVTGGASGIGLATAKRFAAEGARVVIADLQDEPGEKAAAEIGGTFVHADVSVAASWTSLVARTLDEHDGLDVVHLNAGVTTGQGDLAELTDEQYRRIMGANADGVVFGVRAVVPELRRRGGGAIVATASMAGLIAFPPDPIYTATKHFVVGLVRSLAQPLAPITVNAVCPGLVDTPLVGEARAMLEQVGLPLIPPDDIADAVMRAITSGRTGDAWLCRAGQPPQPHDFPEIPVLT